MEVSRVYIANITADQAAQIGQRTALSGTAIAAIGFGAWGVEQTVVVELGGADDSDVERFVRAVFEAAPSEEAVYVVHSGTARIWWRDGRVE